MPNPRLKKLTFVNNSSSPPTTASYDLGADITVDESPIKDSTNPISSGAVYNSLCGISDAMGLILEGPLKPYLTLTGTSPFTLQTYNTAKNWDGTLEYSTDTETWTTWTGSSISSSNNNKLYLRGSDNTYLTGNNADHRLVLTTSGTIRAKGDIRMLLDYDDTMNGDDPTMATYCYYALFHSCTALVRAPKLPSESLSDHCYASMFYGCTGLEAAPELPAITAEEYCYADMFYGCTALTSAPKLPATIVANYCYQNMFNGCTALETTTTLSSIILANHCYEGMFQGCTSLETPPALPAIILDDYCYKQMFYGCTSLKTLPTLSVSGLANYCYQQMFYGCSNIKLSTTETTVYNTEYRIPTTGVGSIATDSVADMFTNTGGTFTGTPAINTVYYYAVGEPPAPVENPYIEFVGTAPFTIRHQDDWKSWDGTMEYSNDGVNWYEWNPEVTSTISSSNTNNTYILQMRGTNNTRLCAEYGSYSAWVISSDGTVECNGNIMNLLDYQTVLAGDEPPMDDENGFTFSGLFADCQTLTKAPDLPAMNLVYGCYESMFSGCENLVTPPSALPATTLKMECYENMFAYCTSLESTPAFPAVLTIDGYDSCYQMFNGCDVLNTLPAIPNVDANSSSDLGLGSMFSYCPLIEISETQTGAYQNAYRIPMSGTASNNIDTNSMFDGTGGTFTGDPDLNTTYYTSNTVIPYIS